MVFFKGVEPGIRKEVWPLLLGLVEYNSTAEARRTSKKERNGVFLQLTSKRYVWHEKSCHDTCLKWAGGWLSDGWDMYVLP